MIDSSLFLVLVLVFNIITIHKEDNKMEKKNNEVKEARKETKMERRIERIVVMIDGVLVPFKSKEELREFYKNR